MFVFVIFVGCNSSEADIRAVITDDNQPQPGDFGRRNFEYILGKGEVLPYERNQGIEEIWCYQDFYEVNFCVLVNDNLDEVVDCQDTWEPTWNPSGISKIFGKIWNEYIVVGTIFLWNLPGDYSWDEWNFHSCPPIMIDWLEKIE